MPISKVRLSEPHLGPLLRQRMILAGRRAGGTVHRVMACNGCWVHKEMSYPRTYDAKLSCPPEPPDREAMPAGIISVSSALK